MDRKIQKIRSNKNTRLIILLIIIAIALGMWFYGDRTNNKILKTGGIIVGGIASLATGLEVSNKDYDLKTLFETGSFKKAFIERDDKGNLLNIDLICDAKNKNYYDYNCDDFKYQEDAQAVYERCGDDVNRLDGDKDGIVCEALPYKTK